jgi:hypothetical protein
LPLIAAELPLQFGLKVTVLGPMCMPTVLTKRCAYCLIT